MYCAGRGSWSGHVAQLVECLLRVDEVLSLSPRTAQTGHGGTGYVESLGTASNPEKNEGGGAGRFSHDL